MNMRLDAARHQAQVLHAIIRGLLRESEDYMSPGEEQWWRRLLGNLEKAQHADPHISHREGAHGG